VSIRYVCDALTTLRPAHAPDSAPALARIHNISRGGISLQVDHPQDSGSILSVEIPADDGQPGSTILTCVVHANELPEGGWLLGCTFVAELSDEDLQPFGASLTPTVPPDKRTWVRFPCDMQVAYRPLRVTERRYKPARIADISASGASLVVMSATAVGTALGIELRGAAGQCMLRIFACVVRITPQAGGEWLMGCNFIRELTDKETQLLMPETNANTI